MSNKKCQVIFFGTPEFAVPTLKALIDAPFCDVVKVITQSDKPVGRHHSKLVPSAVKKFAIKADIPVFTLFTPPPSPLLWEEGEFNTPSTFKGEGWGGGLEGVDLGVLVAYGDIIPKKVIDSFPLGILNIHPSLLPKYRGSSPIQNAILNQDKETGVTIMKLDDEMDHGPIVAQEIVKLNHTETTGELSDKLAQIGADLLIKILPDYIAGKTKEKEQDHDKATFTEKLTKQDGKINVPPHGTFKLEAFVRAMNPWPGAWIESQGKKLIIWSMQKDGTPKQVQLQGKKRMPYSEFLKGHPDFKIINIARFLLLLILLAL